MMKPSRDEKKQSETMQPARKKGKRRSTLTDVARLAGVSRWVAGQVLNDGAGNSRCGIETARRIHEIAEELSYQANPAAMLLRGRRSHTFGLLVASAGDPLRSFLVQYLDREAVKVGCHTLIGNTIGDLSIGPDQFDFFVEEFARRGVDGVFCAVHHWFGGSRRALLARHPNTVFYEDPGIEGAAYVTIDRRQAVRLAVRRLIERGRQRIGIALIGLTRPEHVARYEAFEAEMRAQGRASDWRLMFNGEEVKLAYARHNGETGQWDFPIEVIDAAIDWLVRDVGVDAIVAHDDFWAAAMIRRLRARGIAVPQHVAIVGYLNHYLADWTDPALTTIDLCHETAAQQMVAMLEHMVQHGPLPEDQRVVTIEPRLIVRESA